MKTGVIVAIVAVLIIGGGAFAIKKKNDNDKSKESATTSQSTSTTTSSNNSAPSDQPSPDTSAVATITYGDTGFSPSKITVKAGSKVEIKNTTSHNMQFDSDPHPVHTDDTDLNAGLVAAGGSMTFTVTKKGTFGYHNHLDPSETGTIIIE